MNGASGVNLIGQHERVKRHRSAIVCPVKRHTSTHTLLCKSGWAAPPLLAAWEHLLKSSSWTQHYYTEIVYQREGKIPVLTVGFITAGVFRL